MIESLHLNGFWISPTSFPEQNKTVSSAYISILHCDSVLIALLKYKINKFTNPYAKMFLSVTAVSSIMNDL